MNWEIILEFFLRIRKFPKDVPFLPLHVVFTLPLFSIISLNMYTGMYLGIYEGVLYVSCCTMKKRHYPVTMVFIYTIVASSQYFSRFRQPFPVSENYPQKSFLTCDLMGKV